MISFFPNIYPDELLYSQLARFYVKSGYPCYVYAAEDLFASKTVRPDIEFVNQYTPAALQMITRGTSVEDVILNHTMFPYYGRFLLPMRRQKAFDSLVNMQGNYHNLLPMPNRKNDLGRYLRYCPICADSDRRQYGETYWHRLHQMQGINVCPVHQCRIIDSDVIISGKSSPMLVAAEESVMTCGEITMCENKTELQLSKYVTTVFQADIDIQSNVLVGDFLHSRMSGTKYRSIRGKQRNIAQLHADFTEYYKSLDENPLKEAWQIQKVLTNDKYNMIEICMIAMFLNIPPSDLVHMTLPEKTQEQIFDEEVIRLHNEGLKYPEIARQLNVSLNVVKAIGGKRYCNYHKQSNEPLKSGTKPKDWDKIDYELLPAVKQAISELQGNGISRPKKVTIFAIEKMLNLRSKQIDNLKLCKAEIKKHYMSQHEYWALEVVWAANTLMRDNKPFNWKHIKDLTNMRRTDLYSCLPYISEFADDDLCNRIKAL